MKTFLKRLIPLGLALCLLAAVPARAELQRSRFLDEAFQMLE